MANNADDIKALLSRSARQVGAGAIETFGYSPKAAKDVPLGLGSVIPNFVWGLMSLPELGRKVGYGLAGKEAPYNSFTSPSLEYLQSGIKDAEAVTGATREKSTYDMALRLMGGGGLFSLPVKALSTAPKAVKALTYGFIPSIQSKTLPGAIAENAIPTVIADQMMEFSDPEYQSYVNTINDAEAYPTAVKQENDPTPEGVTQQINTLLDPDIAQLNAKIRALAKVDPNIQGSTLDDTLILNGLAEEDTTKLDIAGEEAKTDWFKVWAGITGSTLTGAGALYLAAKGKAKYANKFFDEVAGASDLVSNRSAKQRPAKVTKQTQTPDSIYSKLDKGYFDWIALTNANLRDPNALLKIAINDMAKVGTISKTAAKKLGNDIVTTLEIPALGNKIKAFVKSGAFPGNESLPFAKRRQTIPLGYLVERIAGLDVKKRRELEDALVAGTIIDDLNVNPKLGDVWGTGDAMKTKAELQRTYNIADNMNNPIVKALKDDIYKYFNDFRDYLHNPDSRVIDKTTYDKWRFDHKRFVPLRYADTPDYGTDSRMARQLGSEGIQPGNVLMPTEMLGEYTIRMIKFAEHNKLRGRLLDNLESSPLATLAGKKLVRLVDKNEKFSDTNMVKVFAGGDELVYKIEDPFMVELLRETPQWAENYYRGVQRFMVGTSKFMKNVTTGKFAWQFAPVSTQYEKMLALAQHPKGQALSWVGKHAPAALRDKYDPTVLIAELPGTIRGIWADVHYAGARKMAAMLADETNTPYLSRMISKPNRAVFQKIMEDGYVNSSKYNAEKYGGGTSALWGDVNDDLPQIITEASAKAGRQAHSANIEANSIANVYMKALENFHSSIRLEGAASNMRRRKVGVTYINDNGKKIPLINFRYIINETDGNLEDAVRAMRELTGDLGKKGGLPGFRGGNQMRLWQDSTPYVNVSLQAIGKFGKAFVDRPVQTISAMFATGGITIAYLLSSVLSDPVKRKEFMSQSPRQRGRAIPFYNDKGELIYKYAIPHEWRAFYSAALEGTLLVLGYSSPKQDILSDSLSAAVGIAFQDLLPDPVPVAAKAVATGIMGQNLPQIPLSRYTINDVQKNKLLPEDDAELIARVRGVVQEILGASATMAIGTVEELYMATNRQKEWKSALKSIGDWLHVRETRTAQLPISLPILGRTNNITPQTYSIAQQPQVEYYVETLKKTNEWLRLYEQGNERRAATKFEPTSTQSFWARGLPGKTDMQGKDGQRKAIIIAAMRNMKQTLTNLDIPATRKDQTQQKNMNQLERQFSDPRSQEAMKNQLFIERMQQYNEGIAIIREFESNITEKLAQIGIDEAFTFSHLPSHPQTSGWGAISPNMNAIEPFMPRVNQ